MNTFRNVPYRTVYMPSRTSQVDAMRCCVFVSHNKMKMKMNLKFYVNYHQPQICRIISKSNVVRRVYSINV